MHISMARMHIKQTLTFLTKTPPEAKQPARPSRLPEKVARKNPYI